MEAGTLPTRNTTREPSALGCSHHRCNPETRPPRNGRSRRVGELERPTCDAWLLARCLKGLGKRHQHGAAGPVVTPQGGRSVGHFGVVEADRQPRNAELLQDLRDSRSNRRSTDRNFIRRSSADLTSTAGALPIDRDPCFDSLRPNAPKRPIRYQISSSTGLIYLGVKHAPCRLRPGVRPTSGWRGARQQMPAER
jgi:hypothetical protein